MARIRSIHPEFCSSEQIAVLSIPARLHFVMSWTYVDDEGRGVDNARLLKAALWPLTDEVGLDDIEAFQAELDSKGRIVRYTESGRGYFVVLRFQEHQKPNRPGKSKLPQPVRLKKRPPGSEHSVSTHGNGDESSRTAPEQLTPGEEWRGGEWRGEEGKTHTRAAADLQQVEDAALADPGCVSNPDAFSIFWSAWPSSRRGHEADARGAWRTARTAVGDDVKVILDGQRRWLAFWEREHIAERFVPLLVNWLAKHDWLLEPPPPAPGKGAQRDNHTTDVVTGFLNAGGDR